MGLITNLNQLLLSLAVIGSIFVPNNVYAVRFNVDGDPRAYPQAVAGLETRDQEVMDLILAVPLAANFPFLALTDGSKGPNSFDYYLNTTAEVMISHAPLELQLQLRKMYFESFEVVENPNLWRESGGSKVFKSTVYTDHGHPKIRIEISAGLENAPTLKKLLKLLAIVEAINTAVALKMYGGADYRLYHYVLHAVNNISTGLLMNELIRNTTLGNLNAEIAAFNGPESIRATFEELLVTNQLQLKMAEIKREHYQLKLDTIQKWVDFALIQRDQKSRAIKGLSRIDHMMDELVTFDILANDSEDRFTKIRRAAAQGDARAVRLLKSLRSPSVSNVRMTCDFLFQTP